GMMGYVPLSSRVFLSWGASPWGWNNFGWNNFGWNNFGWNSWGYDPWGFGSWAYSPWGYNSFGYYGAGFNRFGYSPYYNIQPVYANNAIGVDTRFGNQRAYGPRSNGRASSV